MTAPGHSPVMIAEVLEVLKPRAGAIYVDGTFGAGGYACALLDAADCRVFGIDRDPEAAARAAAIAGAYGDRLSFIPGCFGDMDWLLGARGIRQVDGIALDLGVSSMQLDKAERGFSFRIDGPLDMRMSRQGSSAADVVGGASEAELARIIRALGEERRARRIARAIVEARRIAPITRTGQLADIVRRCQPAPRPGTDAIDPATRTFQALRMYVNDELGELARGLDAAETLLAPGGRLAVVSFHSLEDRLVKNFLRARAGRAPRTSRHLPTATAVAPAPSFLLLTPRAVRPSAHEVTANPRARSARLRAAERTTAPPWPRTAAAGTPEGAPA